MITARKSRQRGVTRVGWLDSRHTFSFGDYHDPQNMGFRSLRVINEDRVVPGEGFGTHGHRDMEIISYVLEGALEHKDSLGTGSVLRPGDVQRMSAGAGVRHSEFNHSDKEAVHFLQIWILPERNGMPASYEEKHFSEDERRGRFRLIAAPEADAKTAGAVTVHQDVALYAAIFAPGDRTTFELRPGRHAWVQVARGAIDVNGTVLKPGDGAAVSDETKLAIVASEPAEVLLFDLA
jgi:redox-sensitive bicupin YhaK (pirin superfamily)